MEIIYFGKDLYCSVIFQKNWYCKKIQGAKISEASSFKRTISSINLLHSHNDFYDPLTINVNVNCSLLCFTLFLDKLFMVWNVFCNKNLKKHYKLKVNLFYYNYHLISEVYTTLFLLNQNNCSIIIIIIRCKYWVK